MNKTRTNQTFNWPLVSTLLLLTGIAGIPAMVILALVALGPENTLASSFVNPAHFQVPLAVFIHGGSGIAFFLTMPFQFSPRLRTKFIKYHKLMGRVAVLSAYVMAISGIWMHNVLSPESQGTRYIVLIITSLLICMSFTVALYSIWKKNIVAHQRWMARSVAITLAAVTPLFVDIVILLMFSNAPNLLAILTELQYNYGRLLGIIINVTVVEIIFWRSTTAQTITTPNEPYSQQGYLR